MKSYGAIVLTWLPLATVLGSMLYGGIRFYIESTAFAETYEDDVVAQIEDDEQRDVRMEWIKDRINELRIEHGKPLLGWPKETDR